MHISPLGHCSCDYNVQWRLTLLPLRHASSVITAVNFEQASTRRVHEENAMLSLATNIARPLLFEEMHLLKGVGKCGGRRDLCVRQHEDDCS